MEQLDYQLPREFELREVAQEKQMQLKKVGLNENLYSEPWTLPQANCNLLSFYAPV